MIQTNFSPWSRASMKNKYYYSIVIKRTLHERVLKSAQYLYQRAFNQPSTSSPLVFLPQETKTLGITYCWGSLAINTTRPLPSPPPRQPARQPRDIYIWFFKPHIYIYGSLNPQVHWFLKIFYLLINYFFTKSTSGDESVWLTTVLLNAQF